MESNQDIEEYLTTMDRRSYFKDMIMKDEIINGGMLTPLYTQSSSNYLIKRNIIFLIESEFYPEKKNTVVYISGSNLIIYDLESKSMRIIQIKGTGYPTSLYSSLTPSKERIIIIGQKSKPKNFQLKLNNLKSDPTPTVEIINIDKKINGQEQRKILDHSFYIEDAYIYDAIVPPKSEYLLTMIRLNDSTEPISFIYIWDYINNNLIIQLELEFKIEFIRFNRKKKNQFLFISSHYAGVWTFAPLKNSLTCDQIIDKGFSGEIADAGFLNFLNKKHIIYVGLKNQNIYLYDESYNLIKSFNINDFYVSFKTIEETEETNLKTNISDHELLNGTKESIQEDSVNKLRVNLSPDNKVRQIIAKHSGLLIFFSNSNICFHIGFDEETQKVYLKAASLLNNNINEKSSVVFNKSRSNFVICTPTKIELNTKSNFKNAYNNIRKSVVKHTIDKKTKKKKYNKHSNDNHQKIPRFHELERSKFHYTFYGFDPSKSIPFYIDEILKNSSNGYGINQISLSKNPKFILSCLDNKQILFFKVNETETLNEMNILSKNVDLKFAKMHSFDAQPVSATLHPLGMSFFLSFKDFGHFYGNLDKEIKELSKTSSYCKSATFSESGSLLAYSSTLVENNGNYNITIINTNTLDMEYFITNIQSFASKIEFFNNDFLIIALFEDNSIYGWRINDKRLMIVPDKNNPEENNFLKNIESTDKFIDFSYDYVIDYLIVLTEEQKVKIFAEKGENLKSTISLECVYTSVLLLRKLEIVIFGSSEGEIKVCLWPIKNSSQKMEITHPIFSEKKLHFGKITNLKISDDYSLLYSSSDDGSLFVSSLKTVVNEKQVDLKTMQYFESKNSITPKFFMNYDNISYLTDNMYKSKLEFIKTLFLDKQSRHNQFQGDIEKTLIENEKEVENKRFKTNEKIQELRGKVKSLEDNKEKQSKELKEKRLIQQENFKRELTEIKNLYKKEKDNYQKQTKQLNEIIKRVREAYDKEISNLDQTRKLKNANIKDKFAHMINDLKKRLDKVYVVLSERRQNFSSEITRLEEEKEKELNDKLISLKEEEAKNIEQTMEKINEIVRIEKTNKSNKEKIDEWVKIILDFVNNNKDLEENYLLNAYKLYQLNQLLKENEKKITEQEKIIKEKRTVNDRLEQLRFVLEYQINNLKKEKEPIEDQIKKFESLHSDFNKRFNSLHNEKIEIEDCINHNKTLIESFKEELKGKKKKLLQIKTTYQNVDLEINYIVKYRFEDKNEILNKVIDCYNTHLKRYIEEENKNLSNKDNRLQAKTIEKEINSQKNTVLIQLAEKTEDIKQTMNDRHTIMSQIQKDNTDLIGKCVGIRTDFRDYQYNINDLEKQFIKLTNKFPALNKGDPTKKIKENIKMAKQIIMNADIEGMKKKSENREILLTEVSPEKKKKRKPLLPTNDLKQDIIKKIEDNQTEMKNQQSQIEKMQKKITEITGVEIEKIKRPTELNSPKFMNNTFSKMPKTTKNKNSIIDFIPSDQIYKVKK